MKKAKKAIFIAGILIFTISCGSTTTNDTKPAVNDGKSSDDKASNNNAKHTIDDAKKADPASVDGLVDQFVSVQECMLAKSNLGETAQAVKIREILDAKRKDTENADLARDKLINACDRDEFTSIRDASQCFKEQCDKIASIKDINPKDCKEPKVSNICQKSFDEVMTYFLLPGSQPKK